MIKIKKIFIFIFYGVLITMLNTAAKAQLKIPKGFTYKNADERQEVKLAAHGNIIAVKGDEKTSYGVPQHIIKVWDTRTGTYLAGYRDEAGGLVAYCITDSLLVVGVKQFMDTRSRILTIPIYHPNDSFSIYGPEDIGSISFMKQQFCIGRNKDWQNKYEAALFLFDPRKRSVLPLRTFSNNSKPTGNISANGRQMAVTSDDYNNHYVLFASLKDPKDTALISRFTGQLAHVYPLLNDKWLLTTWNSCGFCIVDKSGVQEEILLPQYYSIVDACTDANYIHLLATKTESGVQAELLTYSVKDYSFVNDMRAPDGAVAFCAAGDSITFFSGDDSLLQVDRKQYRPKHIPVNVQPQTNSDNYNQTVFCHPSKPLIASVSGDKITIWDLRTGLIVDEIYAYGTQVKFSTFSDELFIEGMSTIYRYDLATHKMKMKESNSSWQILKFGISAESYQWIKYTESDSTISLIDTKTQRTTNTAHFFDTDIMGIEPMDNASFLYYKKDPAYPDVYDELIFTMATTAGKRGGSAKISRVQSWQIKNDKSAIAFCTAHYNESKQATEHAIEIYSLPYLKLISRTAINGYTDLCINHTFTAIAARGASYPMSDSLYVLNFPALTTLRQPLPISIANKFTWDGRDEFVVFSSNNGIATARSSIRVLTPTAVAPENIFVDGSSKTMWVSFRGGLRSYDLSSLSVGKLVDTFSEGTICGKSDSGIYYQVAIAKPGKPRGLKHVSTDGKINEILTTPTQCIAARDGHVKIVVHTKEANKNKTLYISQLNSAGIEIKRDSLPATTPLALAVSAPLMACWMQGDSSIALWDIQQASIINTFGRYKNMANEERLAPQFTSGDSVLISSAGASLHKYYIASGTTDTVRLPGIWGTGYTIKGFALSPNGKNILVKTGISTELIYVCNAETYAVKKRMAEYEAGFTQMQWVNDSIFITLNKDATIRWHNINTGLNYLVSMIDKDGHIVHYEPATRLYASSRKDPAMLAFSWKGQVVPFIQFDARLNRPAHVLKSLGFADERLISMLQRATDKRLQYIGTTANDEPLERLELPVIIIKEEEKLPTTTTSKTLQLTVVATDSISPVSTLHITVNGQPVYGSKGLRIAPAAASCTKKVSVTLSTGTNRIEVYATNSKGVESLHQAYQVSLEQNTEERRIYFIGIGAARYADSSMNLTYAAKDMRDLATAIAAKYPGAFIDTLLNEQITTQTLAGIKKKLLATGVNDRVILAYAGHGLLSDSLDFYFGTYDINFHHPQKGGWSYRQMEDLLDSIPAREKLMLIDACHSGEVDKNDADLRLAMNTPVKDGIVKQTGARGLAIKLPEQRAGLHNSFELMKELFAGSNSTNGAVVISAAGGTEFAFESARWNNGVFTFALLSALTEMKADTDQDGSITIKELKNYLQQTVFDLTHGAQKPTSRQENILYDWRIW